MKNIKNMKKYAIILILIFCAYIIFRELYNYKLEGYATLTKTIPHHDDSLGSINVVCENNGQETPIHDHSTHLSAAHDHSTHLPSAHDHSTHLPSAHRRHSPTTVTAYDKSACTQQEFAAGNCYFEDTSGATAVNGGDDAVNKNSVAAAHAAAAAAHAATAATAATAAVAAAKTNLHKVLADHSSTSSEKAAAVTAHSAAVTDENEAKANHAAAVTALAAAKNNPKHDLMRDVFALLTKALLVTEKQLLPSRPDAPKAGAGSDGSGRIAVGAPTTTTTAAPTTTTTAAPTTTTTAAPTTTTTAAPTCPDGWELLAATHDGCTKGDCDRTYCPQGSCRKEVYSGENHGGWCAPNYKKAADYDSLYFN
jgi:hypothetical protein